jgi:hypothetical protein
MPKQENSTRLQQLGARCRKGYKINLLKSNSRYKYAFATIMAATTFGVGGMLFWNLGLVSALIFGVVASSIGFGLYSFLPNVSKYSNSVNSNPEFIPSQQQDILSPKQVNNEGSFANNNPLFKDSVKQVLFKGVSYDIDLGAELDCESSHPASNPKLGM